MHEDEALTLNINYCACICISIQIIAFAIIAAELILAEDKMKFRHAISLVLAFIHAPSSVFEDFIQMFMNLNSR